LIPLVAFFVTTQRVNRTSFTPPPNTNRSCKSYHQETLVNCEHFQVFTVKSGEYSIVGCDSTRRLPDGIRFGSVFLWKISEPDSQPIKITTGLPLALNPVSVDVVVLDDDRVRIFVVNRHPRRRLVAVLEVDISNGTSNGLAWAMGPAFPSPNAGAALSKDTVLVLNDPESLSTLLPKFLVRPSRGIVAEINIPTDFATEQLHVSIADKVSAPKGIAIDRETGRLWIATTKPGVIEYKYTIAEGQPPRSRLIEQQTYPTPFVPENLSYRGTLVVTGHANLSAVDELSNSESATAPSWVIELQTSTSGLGADLANLRLSPKAPPIWKTLFYDDGSTYSGATAAVLIEDGKKIGVSGFFSKGILICETQ
jgi:hypothetical protein